MRVTISKTSCAREMNDLSCITFTRLPRRMISQIHRAGYVRLLKSPVRRCETVSDGVRRCEEYGKLIFDFHISRAATSIHNFCYPWRTILHPSASSRISMTKPRSRAGCTTRTAWVPTRSLCLHTRSIGSSATSVKTILKSACIKFQLGEGGALVVARVPLIYVEGINRNVHGVLTSLLRLLRMRRNWRAGQTTICYHRSRSLSLTISISSSIVGVVTMNLRLH